MKSSLVENKRVKEWFGKNGILCNLIDFAAVETNYTKKAAY
jgi:hypothetical protein